MDEDVLIERLARLEEQLKESRKDRDALHRNIGSLEGQLQALQQIVDQARGGWRMFLLVSGLAGFVAGTLQTWLGPGHGK